MAGVSNALAVARREAVARLWTRGETLAGIARELQIDRQTARRDVALLGRHAVERLDVPRELARLLLAGRAVETDAWRREQPMQALAAQRQQLQVLSVLQALDLAQRLEQLEAQVAALATAAPPVGMEGFLLPNGRHAPAV